MNKSKDDIEKVTKSNEEKIVLIKSKDKETTNQAYELNLFHLALGIIDNVEMSSNYTKIENFKNILKELTDTKCVEMINPLIFESLGNS